MTDAPFAAVVLAAGEGTRMRSSSPKVLHELAGWPMICHVLQALRPLEPAATVVVVGAGMEAVARAVAPTPTAVQSPPRGTGDAVRAARELLGPRITGGHIADVIVLFGDTPLLRPETIRALLDARRRAPAAAIAAAGMRPADAGPYGRFVLGRDGGLERIAEAKDATAEDSAIGLCNGGIMAIEAVRLFGLAGT